MHSQSSTPWQAMSSSQQFSLAQVSQGSSPGTGSQTPGSPVVPLVDPLSEVPVLAVVEVPVVALVESSVVAVVDPVDVSPVVSSVVASVLEVVLELPLAVAEPAVVDVCEVAAEVVADVELVVDADAELVAVAEPSPPSSSPLHAPRGVRARARAAGRTRGARDLFLRVGTGRWCPNHRRRARDGCGLPG